MRLLDLENFLPGKNEVSRYIKTTPYFLLNQVLAYY